MRILYLDWPCFGKNDILHTLKEEMHHEVILFSHKDYTERKSDDFQLQFDHICQSKTIDCCFSYNFYPLMAEACHRNGIKYISIVYDSPFVKLYSYTIAYPTNYVFLFDYELYRELKTGGINTVYYTVLPVNGQKIKAMLKEPYNKSRMESDISFVGSLYNEDHNLFDRLYEKIDDYCKGYLDGIMASQLKISGFHFIEKLLNEQIIEALHEAEPYEPSFDGAETLSHIYAHYYIDRKLTSMERIRYLQALANKHSLKLFTLDPKATIQGAVNMGTCDYYKEMPYIFHDSKINLNISLRSIQSGIPLRCMDILGAGGFLLTNYQADFLSFFEPGIDFDYFIDENDLLEKTEYYLSHEKERAEIARNGHEKVIANHSFYKTFEDIFQLVFS